MSIQSQLNQQALNMLPLTKDFLRKNKISTFSLLRRICNSHKPLTEMTQDELEKFDANELRIMKEKLIEIVLDGSFYSK